MWNPAHIDGRTPVVIRPRTSLRGGYDVIESGTLKHDGQLLHLVSEHRSRAVMEAELRSLQNVVPQSRIRACRGFDFFLLMPRDERSTTDK